MHKSEDLERDCYGGSWFKDTLDEITNGMFDKITGRPFAAVTDSDTVKINDEYAAKFLEYKNSIDVTLNILLTYETYLTPSDCQVMTEIKFAFSTWQIGENFESVNTKRTFIVFIENIIQIYKQIHYFDISLSHYKYDFQKNLDTRNNQLN
jgi:hypothetical protein